MPFMETLSLLERNKTFHKLAIPTLFWFLQKALEAFVCFASRHVAMQKQWYTLTLQKVFKRLFSVSRPHNYRKINFSKSWGTIFFLALLTGFFFQDINMNRKVVFKLISWKKHCENMECDLSDLGNHSLPKKLRQIGIWETAIRFCRLYDDEGLLH